MPKQAKYFLNTFNQLKIKNEYLIFFKPKKCGNSDLPPSMFFGKILADLRNQKIFLKKMKNESQIRKTLKLLDLSEIEISVYLHLLQFGIVAASTVSRRLDLNRSTTRYTLENLRKKKLVLQTEKNGSFYFSAENPEKIIFLCRAEKQKIEDKESALNLIIGDLKNLQNPNAKLPKVQFFEGVEGICKMYDDVLNENCDVYGYSRVNDDNVHPEILKHLYEVYIPGRIAGGKKGFLLFNDDNIRTDYLSFDSQMNRVSMLVPSKKFQFSSSFHIYADKVAFYSRVPGEDLTGVIIQHQRIHDDQLTLFKMAWEWAKMLPENKLRSAGRANSLYN